MIDPFKDLKMALAFALGVAAAVIISYMFVVPT